MKRAIFNPFAMLYAIARNTLHSADPIMPSGGWQSRGSYARTRSQKKKRIHARQKGHQSRRGTRLRHH